MSAAVSLQTGSLHSGNMHLESVEVNLPTVIIGAGPAGLSAALLLAGEGRRVMVLERNHKGIGGLSRTVVWGERRFDIGGHRFFSKSTEVRNFWTSILREDFCELKRTSSILYKGRLFSYPLKVQQVLALLGPQYSLTCLLSYLRTKALPCVGPDNYEQWMINRFGRVLFETFFRSYTEKVWGLACRDISSDWAAQRTGGVDIRSVIEHALTWTTRIHHVPRSFTGFFHYPRLGAGQMWDSAAEEARRLGVVILEGCRAVKISRAGNNLSVQFESPGGAIETVEAAQIISTATLSENIRMLECAPRNIMDMANALAYRDFVIVALDIAKPDLLDVQWLYVNEPGVRMARIQNFTNWGVGLAGDRGRTLLGVEYFCTRGDDLWGLSDSQFVATAHEELCALGVLKGDELFEGTVERAIEAYPVYDLEYRERVKCLKSFIEEQWPALHLAGRGGLHKYNNMDHSVLTGFMAARNVLAGARIHDPADVNTEEVYLEAGN